uniref:Methyltransferase type 11 domain-containing protein n=1 Tax=Glossina brevipalpis TaxID=37001 RepID=A0A1A9W899_9MUSC
MLNITEKMKKLNADEQISHHYNITATIFAPSIATITTAASTNLYNTTRTTMTKQLSINKTPPAVIPTSSSAASKNGACSAVIQSNNRTNAFASTNYTPTIVSPTTVSTTIISNVATFKLAQQNSVTPIALVKAVNNSCANKPQVITNAITTTTTATAALTSSSSSSSNDANGRSAALERAYVHDVYENCEEPTGSLRPRVAQFLSNLEIGAVVCDVGCGSGRYLTQCNPSICTIGVDRCYRLSRLAKEKGGEVALCDNLELPFRDESFDAVLSVAVIHHFATTERRVNALRELARILRVGGRVLITVWALEQKHRRFESQDVLIPWQPPKNRNLNNSDEEEDDDFLAPYHAYTEDSNSSRSAGDGDSSSLSSSSPGESCYSFVRRAIQKLAGGRKHAWFLDSWTSKDTQRDSSLDHEDAKDLPIELRRLEDFEDFTDPPLSAGLKSRSLGSILNPPPRQIVRSRSSVPSLGGPLTPLEKNNSTTSHANANNHNNPKLSTSDTHSNGTFPRVATDSPVHQTMTISTTSVTTATTLVTNRRPKLIKQKQSLCDEDFQLSDVPFHMLSNYNSKNNSVTNNLQNKNNSVDISKQQLQTPIQIQSSTLYTRQVRKQSSLNEELMAGNRLREKERVRKRIQKQRSLNEAFLCRSAMFSKRLQVIREGFTNKIKSSTGSLERVTKTNLIKIMQNLKNASGDETPSNAASTTKKPECEQSQQQIAGQICTHEHHHHHYHYQSSQEQQQQQQQQHFPFVSNFQNHLNHLLQKQTGFVNNTSIKNFAGPVTICKNVECASAGCYCTAYHQGCSQCNASEGEEKARRHSRESGSDSSKDNSLQSDTSIESEDSFASVIYIPKPEQHQQQLNYQKQHQNSNSSSSNSSSSNGGSCCVHQNIGQNKCGNSTAINHCNKTEVGIPSVPTSPLILPCPPTPAHSPAAAQTTVTSPPHSMATVTAAMAILTPPLKKVIENPSSPTTKSTNGSRFNFDEAHIKKQNSIEQDKLKNLQNDTVNQQTIMVTPVATKITKEIIKHLPIIPKYGKQPTLQLTKQSFPIVRRSSASTGAAIPNVPKLLSLEIYNPAIDDLDSDSSEPSSPDSVDSVISAPKSNTLSAAASLDQTKGNSPPDVPDRRSDESTGIENTQEMSGNIKINQSHYRNGNLKIDPIDPHNIILNDDVQSDILPKKYDSDAKKSITQPEDCAKFAEQLTAQLIRKLEKKDSERKDGHVSDISKEDIDDPFSNYRKRLSEKDLMALRDELRERRLMLANLSTQPSLNQSPASSSTSSLSSQTRSFTIQEEDEDDDEEENERSYSLQLYENCKISKFNYKRNRQYNLHPETAYLLQDEDSSTRDDDEEEIDQMEHNIIMEEDENEGQNDNEQNVQQTEAKIRENENENENAESCTSETEENNSKSLSLNAKTEKLQKEDKEAKDNLDEKSELQNNQSTESWEHSNSSTASLDSPSQGGATTHHRYYHVFREGELDALINHHIASLHIVSSYYERASWCVVAEKVQVWTI